MMNFATKYDIYLNCCSEQTYIQLIVYKYYD